jgi:hypothetical protein
VSLHTPLKTTDIEAMLAFGSNVMYFTGIIIHLEKSKNYKHCLQINSDDYVCFNSFSTTNEILAVKIFPQEMTNLEQ